MTPSRRSQRTVFFLGLAWIVAGAGLVCFAQLRTVAAIRAGTSFGDMTRHVELGSLGSLVLVLGLVLAAAGGLALRRPVPAETGSRGG